eukprot:gnl/TRDRNA2_/TRDRNA2_150837_c0_seq1.p1 gnl/TRDRNA2_/TRDRNA2_150837_c0~~gnl/TRDRNA2_/TRDRNA2_150837_c0_seq1.p1  ORF type:complete len:217 (+),score=27.37 gnl/TRDRNA2_/TRDRNA2_150837_c0_seq1:83-733(+)
MQASMKPVCDHQFSMDELVKVAIAETCPRAYHGSEKASSDIYGSSGVAEIGLFGKRLNVSQTPLSTADTLPDFPVAEFSSESDTDESQASSLSRSSSVGSLATGWIDELEYRKNNDSLFLPLKSDADDLQATSLSRTHSVSSLATGWIDELEYRKNNDSLFLPLKSDADDLQATSLSRTHSVSSLATGWIDELEDRKNNGCLFLSSASDEDCFGID